MTLGKHLPAKLHFLHLQNGDTGTYIIRFLKKCKLKGNSTTSLRRLHLKGNDLRRATLGFIPFFQHHKLLSKPSGWAKSCCCNKPQNTRFKLTGSISCSQKDCQGTGKASGQLPPGCLSMYLPIHINMGLCLQQQGETALQSLMV